MMVWTHWTRLDGFSRFPSYARAMRLIQNMCPNVSNVSERV